MGMSKISPADVIPVPQLERPSEAVDLPKLGGYVTLDSDVVKGLQTPPTTTRSAGPVPHPDQPVEPYGGDDEQGIVATIAAMVLSAMLVRYGGPAMMRMPVRSPLGNPAFGSGGVFLSPRDRSGYSGT